MSDFATYEELEKVVLDAVAAIHCTVERNNLRRCVDAHERGIARLREENEHLRRQLVLIGDSYLAYAASCANSLEHVALAMHAAERGVEAKMTKAM
jgi:hypothetical protein